MLHVNRRRTLQLGLGALAGTTILGRRSALGAVAVKDVAPPRYEIEEGASLRVLRPSKFVQGDETLFLENTEKFTAATGVEVRVDSESWEDLRPKTAVSASVGSGPDVVLAWQEDPHLFPGQTLLLDDLAGYLGEKYGGWFKVAEHYGRNQAGEWIALPFGGAGSTMVYRKSWVNEAGFEGVPGDFEGFLELCKALQRTNHPAGFALGHAVGDAGWTDWVLWGFGSSLIDEDNNVVIDNPKTIEALEYGQGAVRHLHPRHAVLARSLEQQGVPRRRARPHRQRHLGLLCRQELRGCGDQGAGRGHLPRQLPGRAGRIPESRALW